MMILAYYECGNLRNYLNKSENYIYCQAKIYHLLQIAKALLGIHDVERVHQDLHPGNILFNNYGHSCISDLGMCQPANNEAQSSATKEIYGVLPYVAPEVLCGYEYTKASMNEFLSEEIPYSNVS